MTATETRRFGDIELYLREGAPVAAHEPYNGSEDDYLEMCEYLKEVAPGVAIEAIHTPNGLNYIIHPSATSYADSQGVTVVGDAA